MPTDAGGGWTVIVPVKPYAHAKSRMRLPRGERIATANGLAAHVMGVLAGLRSTGTIGAIVVVGQAQDLADVNLPEPTAVTGEPAGEPRGSASLSDPGPSCGSGQGPEGSDVVAVLPAGLNTAVSRGLTWASRHRPAAPVAVLPADLPGLSGTVLEEALRSARERPLAFTADRVGTGSTLLTAARPGLMRSSYGPGSAALHTRAGFVPLAGRLPGLRDDADTAADLSGNAARE